MRLALLSLGVSICSGCAADRSELREALNHALEVGSGDTVSVCLDRTGTWPPGTVEALEKLGWIRMGEGSSSWTVTEIGSEFVSSVPCDATEVERMCRLGPAFGRPESWVRFSLGRDLDGVEILDVQRMAPEHGRKRVFVVFEVRASELTPLGERIGAVRQSSEVLVRNDGSWVWRP